MQQKIETDVVILGGGVSGLATAYWLNKQGIQVTVLEKNPEAGGSMESVRQDGYLFDRGPNSGLEITPLIKEIVQDLGLQNDFLYANPQANKRYIMRNDTLHPLPMAPHTFLQSKLFSGAAKLRLMAEPFIGRSKDGYYQSVAEFVERRLGREFLDYAINPFVAGVYAGEPESLSVKSAFPKLYALEEKYGGILVGTVRSIKARKNSKEESKQSAKMFSFLHGMQTLPKAIANRLAGKVHFLCDVKKVEKENGKYLVSYNKAGDYTSVVEAKVVISTLPAHVSAPLYEGLLPGCTEKFEAVYHPPVLVLFLGYKKEQIGRAIDGFGYLIPALEKKSYLGALWSSAIFNARAPKDSECFTLFIGGSRNASLFEKSREEIIKQAMTEFAETMKITGEPDFIKHRFWSKAIPQYNIGYVEIERYFDTIEEQNPGLFFSGNFRGGISVGDCIKNSFPVSEKVIEKLKSI